MHDARKDARTPSEKRRVPRGALFFFASSVASGARLAVRGIFVFRTRHLYAKTGQMFGLHSHIAERENGCRTRGDNVEHERKRVFLDAASTQPRHVPHVRLDTLCKARHQRPHDSRHPRVSATRSTVYAIEMYALALFFAAILSGARGAHASSSLDFPPGARWEPIRVKWFTLTNYIDHGGSYADPPTASPYTANHTADPPET